MPQHTLAIDIGGTKTAIALVDPENGQVAKAEKFATEKSSPEAFLNQLLANITPYLQDAKAIGIAAAGLVDPENGLLIKAPNLPKSFQNLKITQHLKEKTGLRTTIDNDGHCFTLAEAHFGQGKGKNIVFGVTLGTGIGGGLTFKQRLLSGPNNSLGEIGHITLISALDENKNRLCSCGKIGHLEAYASGSAMSNIYKEATGETITAIEIEKRALNNDEHAKQTNTATAKALAEGLSTIIHLINPDCIILGGGLLKMTMYTEEARNNIAQHLAFNQLADTPILDAALGDNAQLIGAAMLTL